MRGYGLWLERVHRVVAGNRRGRIAPEQLVNFQLHLLEFGRFNANFTLAELEHLKYPKSPLEDRGFLIRGGGYMPDRAVQSFKAYVAGTTAWVPAFHLRYPAHADLDYQYMPTATDTTTLSVRERKLVVERDFVCVQASGVTVYKRFFSNENTGIEIDCWQEKDPVVARFMSLVIAIYVKEKQNAGFKTRDARFTHFLFHLAYEAVNAIFKEAVEAVLAKKTELGNCLARDTSASAAAHGQYSFFHQEQPRYDNSSAYNGPSWFEDAALVDRVKSILVL